MTLSKARVSGVTPGIFFYCLVVKRFVGFLPSLIILEIIFPR